MIQQHRLILRKATIIICIICLILTAVAAGTPGVIVTIPGTGIEKTYSVFQYCNNGVCAYATQEAIGCTETVSRLRCQGAFLVFHAISLIMMIPTMVGEIKYWRMPLQHLSYILFLMGLATLLVVVVLMVTTLRAKMCGMPYAWSDRGGVLGPAFALLVTDLVLYLATMVVYAIGMKIEEVDDSSWAPINPLMTPADGGEKNPGSPSFSRRDSQFAEHSHGDAPLMMGPPPTTTSSNNFGGMVVVSHPTLDEAEAGEEMPPPRERAKTLLDEIEDDEGPGLSTNGSASTLNSGSGSITQQQQLSQPQRAEQAESPPPQAPPPAARPGGAPPPTQAAKRPGGAPPPSRPGGAPPPSGVPRAGGAPAPSQGSSSLPPKKRKKPAPKKQTSLLDDAEGDAPITQTSLLDDAEGHAAEESATPTEATTAPSVEVGESPAGVDL